MSPVRPPIRLYPEPTIGIRDEVTSIRISRVRLIESALSVQDMELLRRIVDHDWTPHSWHQLS